MKSNTWLELSLRLLLMSSCLLIATCALQGCFIAAAPMAPEVETAAENVAPTGAWDVFQSLSKKPDPLQIERTRLQIQASQQELSLQKEEVARSKSERAATLGVLQDLWNWQHDPAIGDLLIYVKAGGDPATAMQAAITRLNQISRPQACVNPTENSVAQASLTTLRQRTN